MADHELERFKRDINLIDYAKRAGFEPSRGQGGEGLTFLEHPNRDAIVVARNRGGQWIYASVPDCPPRAPGESAERAEERVRASIARTRDKGSIVEFVQHRDCTARTGEVGVALVRGRLRDFQESGVSLDSYGALRLPVRFGRHPRDVEEAGGGRAGTDPPRSAPERPVEWTAGGDEQTQRALNRRIGDWSPMPLGSGDTVVEERLRRWQEAQHAVDRKLGRPGDLAAQPPRGPSRADDKTRTPSSPPLELAGEGADKGKLALGQRRYDWSPPVQGVPAIPRGSHDRGPDRGR